MNKREMQNRIEELECRLEEKESELSYLQAQVWRAISGLAKNVFEQTNENRFTTPEQVAGILAVTTAYTTWPTCVTIKPWSSGCPRTIEVNVPE